MLDENLMVEGFYFEDEETARQAVREYSYIGKMQDKISRLHPDELKEFYHKLIEKELFTTQVGLTYLYEIRSTLVEQCGFADTDLAPIWVSAQEKTDARHEAASEDLSGVVAGLKRTRTLLAVAVVVLAVVIVGIFIMVATNRNMGYINTENKILDKYAQWAEELDAREQALEEREQALKEQTVSPSGTESIDIEE